MKAIVVGAAPDYPLEWQDVADPQYEADEVLVDICATAVNRADLLQRAGHYPPPLGAPPGLGLEMAGIVAEAGAGAAGFLPGERVCALLSGGGYAEQVAVNHQLLVRIPDDWAFTTAAAVPEVFYTAFVNLFLEAGLEKGETVLIHGGASGVGTAAIQLARAEGCRVLVTAGSAEKRERCHQLGAELAIDYKKSDFADAVLTHCDGADVVLDIVGASYLEQNLKCLKLRGRLVTISLLGGATAALNLATLMTRRLRIIGSVLRSRSLEEKIAIVHEFNRRFWPRLQSGVIAPVIHDILPIAQAAAAHDILTANLNIGKVVLQVR